MTDRGAGMTGGGGILGGVSAPALDGLCVIEISETPAGAYAGRLLAGMGAEVLMVEPPLSPLPAQGQAAAAPPGGGEQGMRVGRSHCNEEEARRLRDRRAVGRCGRG